MTNSDGRTTPEAEQWADGPKLGLDVMDWQRAAFSAWEKNQRGVVAAVTGSGKTYFALLCIDTFRHEHASPTVLIEVPTRALLDQWYVNLVEDYDCPPGEIALLSGSNKTWRGKPLIVSVINTARGLSEEIASSSSAMLVVDECHRAGSPMNALALRGTFVACLGLSATPERQYDTGFEEFVVPAIGPVIYSYDYSRAAADGVITPFSLVNIKFSLSKREKSEYDALTRRIMAARERNAEDPPGVIENLLRRRGRVTWNSPLRVALAAKLALKHRPERTVIFHESTKRADEICDLLVQRGLRATAYHTRIGEVRRRENLRLFRRGHYSCLVCCRALDEGLNVPATSIGIVASGSASTRQRIQRLGRVLRKLPGKNSALIYTLFATPPEAQRLRDEEVKLSDVANVSWLEAETPRG